MTDLLATAPFVNDRVQVACIAENSLHSKDKLC